MVLPTGGLKSALRQNGKVILRQILNKTGGWPEGQPMTLGYLENEKMKSPLGM
jgi:hypothetical protein